MRTASFRIVGTDRTMSLFDVAKAAKDPKHVPAGEKPGLDDEFTRTPEADTFPNGCHICELEIDPDTGTLEILNYSVMDDFGSALNPLLLQGQVHGGVGQGVGQALTEKTVYDKDSGQLMSGSFMDYALPRADIVPHVHFDMHNSLCTTNPLGVKGAGEAGAIGAPPAVINAIIDAIHPHTGAEAHRHAGNGGQPVGGDRGQPGEEGGVTVVRARRQEALLLPTQAVYGACRKIDRIAPSRHVDAFRRIKFG